MGKKIVNFGIFQKINSNGFFNRISKIINFLLYITFKIEPKTQIALFPFLIKYYNRCLELLSTVDTIMDELNRIEKSYGKTDLVF